MRQKLFVVASSWFLNNAANFGLTNFWPGRRVRNLNPRVSHQKTAAMTLTEVLVVIVMLAVLVAILLPALKRSKGGNYFSCGRNLREIGMAYRIWAGDNGDKFPMQVSVANGGTMELNAD